MRETLDLTLLQINKYQAKRRIDWVLLGFIAVCVLVTVFACMKIKERADNPTEYEQFVMENYKNGITLQDTLRMAENGK
ncbi:MAG: hypothetical protein Q7U10_08880 [Thermodesulfovibrionia bacterium]|nr:hypothetical protein [Thermodesulfovibrionia bacterium]